MAVPRAGGKLQVVNGPDAFTTHGGPLMDELIPTLHVLLDPLAGAFRQEVHARFCTLVAAWIVCLGRRTISRVWETTGQTEKRNHAAAFRLYSQAAWNWDEVCRLL